MSTVPPSYDEEPFFFPAEGETLFGVLTSPAARGVDGAVIVLPGGSAPTSTGRNRLSVRLARRATEHGWHGVRFDFHGVGESTGTAERLRLDQPFAADLLAAIRWLRKEKAITRYALVGSCLGSRTALACGAAELAVEALCLLAVPIRDFEMGHRISTRLARDLTVGQFIRRALQPKVFRGLLHGRTRRSYARIVRAKWDALVKGRGRRRAASDDWISPAFLGQLERIMERRVAVLFLYGEEDDFLQEFRAAMPASLEPILGRDGSRAEMKTVPGHLHGFTELKVQDRVVELVSNWLASLPVEG